MDALARRRIGEFVLDQPLGASDAAVVYRAYQPTLNRYVALKVISMQGETLISGSAMFERRFTQEAEVLTSLEHPHIVPIYHYGVVKTECAYIAMRLMHGSLKDLLNESPLPADRVVDIILQLIDGLNYAHKKGVIHHAIKPGNILFDEAGSACLTDFGLSNVMYQSLDIQRDDIISSAPYTAPEMIRNASTDHRSDIYSLGVIMYQLLTGRLPFEVEDVSVVSLLRKIEHDEPIPPRSINPDISVEIERVVLQALQKEPRERFFDAAEMVEALQAISNSNVNAEPSSPRRTGISAMIKRPTRQSSTPLIFSLIVLATLIGLLVLLTNVAGENNTPHLPTVIARSSGSFEVAEPTVAEIARAQAKLGETGFIAFIACSLDSQFQATRAREMSDFAEGYGLPYRVYDSGNDAYIQLTIIERARLEGSRAIILCPLKPSLLADSLRSLRSAGIPFVLTNAIRDGYGGVMLDLNDYEVGRMAGEYVGQILDENDETARIILLTAPDHPFSEERTQGFLDGLNSEQPSVEMVARYPTGSDRNASESEIATLMRNDQDIDAIFSVTDSGAYGAIAALEVAGVEPSEVIIASVNAESLALDEIYNNTYLRASVDIARNSGSQGALDAVVKMLGGGTLPEILTLPPPTVITYDIISEQAPNE